MSEGIEEVRAEVAALREEIARLRAELAELRDYIGEVPMLECGITSFEEWQENRRG